MKLKVASGQVLDRRSIEAPTLTVELTDLGKGPMGATVAEVGAEVIQTVKKRVRKSSKTRSPSRPNRQEFLAWDRADACEHECDDGRRHRCQPAAQCRQYFDADSSAPWFSKATSKGLPIGVLVLEPPLHPLP